MNKKIFSLIFILLIPKIVFSQMKFDSNKYINISDVDTFSFTDGSGTDQPYSFMAWIYYTDTRDNGYFPIVSKFTNTSPFTGEYLFCIFETSSFGTAGADQLFIENMVGASSNRIKAESATAIPRNTWVHVAVTYSGSEASSGYKLYLNGDLMSFDVASEGSYTGMQNLTAPLQIGATLTSSSFDDYANGSMDDVRIYNRELTSDEIASIGKSRVRLNMTDGLVGYWTLDDGNIGTTSTGAVILDRSSNANNGTPTNGLTWEGSSWISYP